MACSSQTGEASSMSYPLPQRLYRCDLPEPCVLQPSNSVANPERHYFHCCHRGRHGDCKYWDWVNPKLSTYYKDRFLKIKLERDLALDQIIRERKKNEKMDTTGDEEFEKSEDVDEYPKLGQKMLTLEKRMKVLYLGFAFVAVLVFFRWF